ncbi:MAG TPA: sulfite exporter TauE/SafE family protein [Sphingomicrobium sp.]|nr:sulfite exporter TauE/SafE family protein [Sphingomicrobium sp.]
MLIVLLVPLALATLFFTVVLIRTALAARVIPNIEAMILGALTNFFDTLGIGSFAPTMAWFKFRNLVPDRLIPSTMLVGHSIPSIQQAFIFLILLGLLVDPVLIVGCALALMTGGMIGVPLVARAKVWLIQLAVGIALLIAAILYTLSNLELMPAGGVAASLPIDLTIIAIAANFIFGILLNFGIGHYAPSLAMLSLMGLDPRLAFPIMATGGALTIAGAGTRHVMLGNADLKIATGIVIGGIPAVFLAAFIVRDLPLEMLRWLVAVVVLYASAVMFHASRSGRLANRAEMVAASETG